MKLREEIEQHGATEEKLTEATKSGKYRLVEAEDLIREASRQDLYEPDPDVLECFNAD